MFVDPRGYATLWEMPTDLTNIEAALAGLTDIELHALIIATHGAPQIAPSLLAWIEGACDWEIKRRVGREYKLLPPDAAIDPSEDAVSIEAAISVREAFASSDFAPEALKFFDALLALLKGGGAMH